MVKINILVHPRDECKRNRLVKNIQWGAVPSKGDQIDLCDEGYAGGPTGVVMKVSHWLGCGDIDVHCSLVLYKKGKKAKDEEEDANIKSLLESGWRE